MNTGKRASGDSVPSAEMRERMAGELSRYHADSEPFFAYLETRRGCFTVEQFQAHRDNYLYRTFYTCRAVGKVVDAALANGDWETLQTAGKNLFEETGEGGVQEAHPKMLEFTFARHGEVVFQVPPVSLNEAAKSSRLLSEVRTFREAQIWCYENPKYPVVLGASFAQESAANRMLETFHRTLFLPYEHLYCDRREFELVEKYFLVHIRGLEDAHAANAQAAILRRCRTEQDLDDALVGMRTFLNAQSDLWRAMHAQLMGLEDSERNACMSAEQPSIR